jgi:hypothetical protein
VAVDRHAKRAEFVSQLSVEVNHFFNRQIAKSAFVNACAGDLTGGRVDRQIVLRERNDGGDGGLVVHLVGVLLGQRYIYFCLLRPSSKNNFTNRQKIVKVSSTIRQSSIVKVSSIVNRQSSADPTGVQESGQCPENRALVI